MTPRALCPLCGRSSQTAYEAGFALDEGLRRHLEGYGNTGRCGIMEIALGLARSRWASLFYPAGSPQRFELERILEVRRRSELQYLVDPCKAPRLIDEDIGMRAPRDAVSYKWAQERLSALGFEQKKVGNICSFTKEITDAIIFCDPRRKDALHFFIALKPVNLDLPLNELRRIATVRYAIPDKWKHGLSEKLDAAILNAVKELVPKLRVVPQ